jgi:zinc transport system permease protein
MPRRRWSDEIGGAGISACPEMGRHFCLPHPESAMPAEWVGIAVEQISSTLDVAGFYVRATAAIVLVSLLCGMMSSLVVGNRMAFFSDAMAHCAFAGMSLGVLTALLVGADPKTPQFDRLVPLIVVGFGIIVGVAIAYVRERTDLASDTVIGVFFALAIGFGAMLLPALNKIQRFEPEQFLFGSSLFAQDDNLLYLLILFLVTVAVLVWRYNALVFASVNPSLARSRRIAVRTYHYLFVVLLAVVVNLSLQSVGALLINALLIVPAAAASNLTRNLRQLFWVTVAISLVSGVGGLIVSSTVRIPFGRGQTLDFPPSGTTVVICVLIFFGSMVVAAFTRRRNARISTPAETAA